MKKADVFYPITRDTMKNSSIKSKVRIGIKCEIHATVKNVSQNKKVFAKTTAERNEERGNVLRHQNTFLIANNAGSGEAVTYSEPSESLMKSFYHSVEPKTFHQRGIMAKRLSDCQNGTRKGQTIISALNECT